MEIRKKIKVLAENDIFQTALWIGFSAGLTGVIAYLLQEPELVKWYGALNFALYALKSINDKRKK